jgi:hypothetical protein
LVCATLALSLVQIVGAVPVAAAPQTGEFVCKWGTPGSGDGEFDNPKQMAFAGGYAYVTEYGNDSNGESQYVQKFTPCTADQPAVFVSKWGGHGTDPGKFNHPEGIAAFGGDIYVADTFNNRIQVFDLNGTYLRQWGSTGKGDGQFELVPGIAIDNAGNVYTADVDETDRIQMFNNSGGFIASWGGNGNGSGPCEFFNPEKLAVDAAGNIFVADHFNHRIVKIIPGVACVVFAGVTGVPGDDQTHLEHPHGVTVDSAGNVFVADTDNQRIVMYDPAGNFVTTWGSYGTGDGQFISPIGMGFDGAGRLYVTEFGPGSPNQRVQVFNVPHSNPSPPPAPEPPPPAPEPPPPAPQPPPADDGQAATSNVNAVLQEGGKVNSAPVLVAWSSADGAPGATPLAHQVQRRRIRGSVARPWHDLAIVSGVQSIVDRVGWRKYQYRVRTQDQAGTWGPWAASNPIKLLKFQERSFNLGRGWRLLAQTSAMGGQVASSSSANATATLAFKGNGVALVAPTGGGRGTLEVCLDPGSAGESCRVVDLGSSSPSGARRLVVSFAGLNQANHVLRVTVLSGTVAFDAAIVSRTGASPP